MKGKVNKSVSIKLKASPWAPSIKSEMMYEMENIFAIVMSNKGSYPKYIKRHTIQKQQIMQGISLRNGGNFGFV